MAHKNQALTLLEVALVLTIIGLIVGGYTVVQALIRNSELQSVIDDEDKYKKAIELFKEKYNYLPGDLPTATNLWGKDPNGCPDTTPSTTRQAATCNCDNSDGNCDGRIDTRYKVERAWQQLADAGLIAGTYTGVQSNNDSASSYASWSAGVNMPASKIPGCGWVIDNLYATQIAIPGGPTAQFRQGTGLGLVAGGADASYPPCLTPSESESIDAKIDDGLPYSGNVIDGPFPYQVMNATEAGVTTAIIADHQGPDGEWPCTTAANLYNTSASGTYCTPFFNTGL